jgi:hypothetical protein
MKLISNMMYLEVLGIHPGSMQSVLLAVTAPRLALARKSRTWIDGMVVDKCFHAAVEVPYGAR